MKDSLGEIKYKKIPNFLSKGEVDLLHHYSRIAHRLNFDSFEWVQSEQGDTSFYGDKVIDALLVSKNKTMNDLVGLELLPTYSYWRMYTFNADLKKHKDRPSCEYSVTVNLGSCGTDWPIFINDKSIILQPGDGVVYAGCEVEHWRENFTGDYCAQAFLHYVNKNGIHANHFRDGRMLWGTQKGG